MKRYTQPLSTDLQVTNLLSGAPNPLISLPNKEHDVNVRWLGLQNYLSCWQSMRDFTKERHEETTDEIWLLEHYPVFTQGQNGKSEHILDPGNIPIVQTDRGGQVTYHGPGQLMVYTLIDLKRKKFNIRELVSHLEQSIIDLLAEFSIHGFSKREAPGVYVKLHEDVKKICSVGLRIRRGYAYHGIAFNVNMDLQPFSRINPCGFSGLKMAQFAELGGLRDTLKTGYQLVNYLIKNLRYTNANYGLY
jgi:lipoyl(octanoyl) transferase